MGQHIPKGFGHVERMDKGRVNKNIRRMEVDGAREDGLKE